VALVYKNVALHVLTDSELTLAGAVGSLCAGSARFTWAVVMDKYGFRACYGLLLCL